MERSNKNDHKRVGILIESLFQSEIELLPKDLNFIVKQLDLIKANLALTSKIVSSKNTEFRIINSTEDVFLTIKTGNKTTSVKQVNINHSSKQCYTIS